MIPRALHSQQHDSIRLAFSLGTVHTTREIAGALLNSFSFINPMAASFIERDPIRYVAYVIIELHICFSLHRK